MNEMLLKEYFSTEQLSKLHYYTNTLLKWNQKINLTSRKNNQETLYTFALEAYAMLQLINDFNSVIVDFGSGGGIPGIILAILGCTNLYLVELITKRANFLHFISAELNLNTKVYNKNIKDFFLPKVDYLISKAVSRPEEIMKITKHLQPNKIIIPSKTGHQVTLNNKIKFFFEVY
jgi:16S rRNA (guanine527-N7)-methyltransferase